MTDRKDHQPRGKANLEIAHKAVEGEKCHLIAYASGFDLAQNSNRLVSLTFLAQKL